MWEIEQLSEDQLHAVFGVNRQGRRAPGFPTSEPDSDGVQRWPADRVWEWLAAQHPQAAAVVPLRYWPVVRRSTKAHARSNTLWRRTGRCTG